MVPKRRDTPHGRSDGLYTDRQKGKKPDCEGVCAPFFCVLTVLCLKRKDNEIQQNNKEKQQNRKTTNEQDKHNKRREKQYSSIHLYISICTIVFLVFSLAKRFSLNSTSLSYLGPGSWLLGLEPRLYFHIQLLEKTQKITLMLICLTMITLIALIIRVIGAPLFATIICGPSRFLFLKILR